MLKFKRKIKEIQLTIKDFIYIINSFDADELDSAYKSVSIFFNVDESKDDFRDVIATYRVLTDYLNTIINSFNFLTNKEEVEEENQVGSAFDELDEEEGYNDEEADVKDPKALAKEWRLMLNSVIMYSINNLNNSYYETLKCSVVELMQYIEYDKDYREKHKDDFKEGGGF